MPVLLALFLWTSTLQAYEIVAFHGLNQSLKAGPKPTGCSAASVNSENHKFIENTIPSLKEAFRIGATIGHFNIRRTADKHLVAFHDARLECRTDLEGSLREMNLPDLLLADVGYGY